jgi:hypothetical protein
MTKSDFADWIRDRALLRVADAGAGLACPNRNPRRKYI